MGRLFALLLRRREVVSSSCISELIGNLVPVALWRKGCIDFSVMRHRYIPGVSVLGSVASRGCFA